MTRMGQDPRPDYRRIADLEQELGFTGQAPPAHLSGYVVLLDTHEREASDRVPVTVSVSIGRGHTYLNINGGPITLTPTRFGSVRAVFVSEGSNDWVPACSPDLIHKIGPGDTFQLTP